MWEVGFANLAFGCMALLAVFADWGVKAQALVVLGTPYLFQAAMLHLYRYLTDATRSRARLYRAVLLTLVMVAMLAFFGIYAAGLTGSALVDATGNVTCPAQSSLCLWCDPEPTLAP